MTGDRQRVRSGWAARLGLFAILFQAILFGWHHHDLTFAGSLPAPVIQNSPAPPQALDDEDGCEICSVLHHLTAAPVDLLAAPMPAPVADIVRSGNAAVVAQALALAFRARAPPSLA
jgi:hypothetical protein